MKYLIDTCVISELMKTKPNPKVINWINKYPQEDLYLSVIIITIMEIKKGICKLVDGTKKEQLNYWLKNNILTKFENNLLKIDSKIALKWGEIQASTELSGYKQPILDSLIATSALEFDLIVATRNTKDFIHSGCKIFNPWE